MINLIKNVGLLRTLIATIFGHYPPSQRNKTNVFRCLNCRKLSHMAKKYRSRPKLFHGSNKQVYLIGKKFISMITKIINQNTNDNEFDFIIKL